MAADSRSTHTDALATLGTIIDITKEKRDAIHLGVEPAIASSTLYPGQHVGYTSSGRLSQYANKKVGIVDPFLPANVPIEKGQAFWLIVYPRQITSLRHVWEHPDFPDSQESGGKELMKESVSIVPVIKATEEQDHKARLLIGEPKAVAKEVIINIAKGLDVEYDELMQHAKDYIDNGSYWVHPEDGGKFEGESLPDSFWPAYEVVTGEEVKDSDKYSFLSCSC